MYYLSQKAEDGLRATPKVRYENNRKALTLLKEIQQQNRTPSDSEKEILASFNGWGALAQVFNLNPEDWTGRAQQDLKQILTPEEYNQAASSIINPLLSL